MKRENDKLSKQLEEMALTHKNEIEQIQSKFKEQLVSA